MAVTPSIIAVALGQAAPESGSATEAQWQMWIDDAERAISRRAERVGVDEATIKSILDILDESTDSLKTGKPGSLNGAYLGGSDAASQLSYHTSLAHQHVEREVVEQWWCIAEGKRKMLRSH